MEELGHMFAGIVERHFIHGLLLEVNQDQSWVIYCESCEVPLLGGGSEALESIKAVFEEFDSGACCSGNG